MRRLLLVMVLAAVALQPALADPKDKDKEERSRQAEIRHQEKSKEKSAREARPRPAVREESRRRDDARVRVDDRRRDDARVRVDDGRGDDVRVRVDDRRRDGARVRVDDGRGGDVRVRVEDRRDDVRYKGERGNAYGRGPNAPGVRAGQRRAWIVPGPHPGPAVGQRGRVYIHPSFPIRRSFPTVIVRRHPSFWGHVHYFGPSIIFAPRIVVMPRHDRLVWEDSQTLYRGDGWTDFYLDVDDYGGALYMEVTGTTRVDWAEVVFDDGRARVVDFRGDVLRPGVYTLLDFRGGQDVAYVRLVARAMSPRSQVVVSMSRW